MTVEWTSNDPVGSRRFEILGEIARGRMAVVYRVRDHALGRDVAFKTPAETALTGPEAGRRFADQVRITAQLQHPGIPPVFDTGSLPDGRPFMAMKLIQGRTLDEILYEGVPWATERGRLLAVFECVCQTVAYAHAKGVIHRNLEPANIMIGAFGEVQVLGWGLAFVIPKEGSQAVPAEEARHGAVFGNSAYMAPEQARGEATDVRADVFGLGGLLCHMLTGAPPYLGEGVVAVARAAAGAKLDDAGSRLDKCTGDKELAGLARQCLRPRREERPSDAGAVAGRVARIRWA